MAAIWSDQSRFQIWLEIEILAFEKLVEEGYASKEALAEVKAKARFDAVRVLEIEREVKHDVIAFLTNVAEHVGNSSRMVHRGMTSSDVLDTALAVQLKRSGELITQGLEQLLATLKRRAVEHKDLVCIGRSHGIHAEPITFGLKVIGWYAEIRRHHDRIQRAISEVAVGKISGPVGTFATVSPAVEAHVMKALGLKAETVSTQIVARDRHAVFFGALASLGSSIERIATEIRHLQRSEVREVEEDFGKGQKGSSSMPHKKNPILSENLCGLARLLRSYASAALENVPLWHERDISHSSVERVIGPDSCILADFMVQRLNGLISGLKVYPENMQKNLELTRGVIFSGPLMIALADTGMTREEAYKLVQAHALEAWQGGADFKSRVTSDPAIADKLSSAVLAECFDMRRHLRHIDFVFERALKE